MPILRLIVLGIAAASLAPAADVQGDAQRGEELFQSEHCIQCHAVNGRGGSLAPDLGRHLDRDFTPAAMAALMWNHAPQMWSAMRQAGIVRGTLSPESASDLFAYFVAQRYFEKLGDAARGKQAFAALHCAECHGITTSGAEGAPPVDKWDSLADPVTLVQQMWDHGAKMREAYAAKKLTWTPITGQQLRDILVYLQGLPANRSLVTAFSFPSSQTGADLFHSKGCADCHTGTLALETLLRNQSLTEVAADMWNHQTAMKQPAPDLSAEEMRQLLAYIWLKSYLQGSGDAARGKKVFAAKHCASCHEDASSGAPRLGKTPDGYSDISMISTLWDHGPRMLELMNDRKLAWPRFTTQEMNDLIAYLNSLT